MADIGNPFGFDVATVLTGSGLTLLISAAIMRYGERFEFTQADLYMISGGVFVGLGVLYGLALILTGYR